MAFCQPTWALLLLGPVLALTVRPAPDSEASPEKLCGAHFVRVLVQICGGPRWSSEAGRPVASGDRELLKWLEGQHLHGLVANRDLRLASGPQPLLQVSSHHHWRRQATAYNPAQRCCLSGCTHQTLLALCPH